MATVDAFKPPTAEPSTRRWTKDEFYQMGELGWFNGQRAELIDGEIVGLSPQSFRHSSTTDRVFEVLRATFGNGYWVRMQLPLDSSGMSLPEPDISVVAGSRDQYTDHPARAVLVVEVSDTTLSFDRSRKAANYAAAGVPDYWIVNLNQKQLEVFRDPQPDSAQANGWRYGQCRILKPSESVSPLQLPNAPLLVASLLPPS